MKMSEHGPTLQGHSERNEPGAGVDGGGGWRLYTGQEMGRENVPSLPQGLCLGSPGFLICKMGTYPLPSMLREGGPSQMNPLDGSPWKW